jgi:hypothetical protein
MPGRSTVRPNLDLKALADDADLVLVGRVIDHEESQRTTLGPLEGNLPAQVMRIRVGVEKVFKGQTNVSVISFKLVVDSAGIGYRDAPRGQFGVFFLRRAQEGYEVLDPYHPFVPAAPGAPQQGGNCLDKVVAELAHVFDLHDTSVQSRWVRWEAVKALESVPTPQATAALKAATHDPEPLVRIWAISALLNRGDTSMLEEVEKLGPIPPDPHVINLTGQLTSAMARIADKRAIPSLARLLQSRDVNIRRGAAMALRNTRDSAAIKPLTEALFDSDREVQYQAVIGLAEITGAPSEWSPASGTFDKDPKKYLDHWRDWAKTNK